MSERLVIILGNEGINLAFWGVGLWMGWREGLRKGKRLGYLDGVLHMMALKIDKAMTSAQKEMEGEEHAAE